MFKSDKFKYFQSDVDGTLSVNTTRSISFRDHSILFTTTKNSNNQKSYYLDFSFGNKFKWFMFPVILIFIGEFVISTYLTLNYLVTFVMKFLNIIIVILFLNAIPILTPTSHIQILLWLYSSFLITVITRYFYKIKYKERNCDFCRHNKFIILSQQQLLDSYSDVCRSRKTRQTTPDYDDYE